MRIQIVPNSLQREPHKYPPHSNCDGIERSFARYAVENSIATSAIYLPIFWTNNYHNQRIQSRFQSSTSELAAVVEVEDFIKTLNPREQYFTVSQGADGIYEELPPNIFVFSAGGIGDEPIPLTCTPHPTPPHQQKDVLASFMGEMAPCGPVVSKIPLRHSSSDKNGAGTRVRQKMIDTFAGVDHCIINKWVENISVYRLLTARSRFGLSPRGYGKTSYRLYEMFSMGAVPVYIYDDPWIPYQDELDWSTFCVLCPESQIHLLPYRLRGLSESWVSAALRIGASLFDRYFTTEGVCSQIAKMVEARWK